jgi:hypothetical protein
MIINNRNSILLHENTHHKHQIDMFESFLRLTSRPSTVKVVLAILGGDKEGYMVIP